MVETVRAALFRNASRLFSGHRRPELPSNPISSNGATLMPEADQSQAAFFDRFPTEIRALIFTEAIKDGNDVVHVLRKGKRKLEYVKCKSKCQMEFNFQCLARNKGLGNELLLAMLQTCQKAYIS